MQAPDRNILSRFGETGAIIFLAIYLAVSVTSLPPLLVISPLLISGLCLLAQTLPASRLEVTGQCATAMIIVGLFLVSYLLSVVFSQNLAESLNAMVQLFPGLLIAYILNRLPLRLLRKLSWTLSLQVIAVTCVVSLMFLNSSYSIPSDVFQKHSSPTLVVPNDILVGVIYLPVVWAVLLYERSPLIKILAMITVVALVIVIYAVESRVCVLTLLCMIVLHLFYRHKKQFLLRATIVVLAVYFADFFFKLGLVNNLYLLREENARLSIWLAALSRWVDHPFVGVGPSNFEIAYESGLAHLKLPDWIMVEPRRIPWAHNLYIEALIERGVAGLLSLALLIGFIFSRLRQQWLFSANSSNSANSAENFYFAVFISFGGFVFAGFFEPTLQRIWVANSLFIYLGLACRGAENLTGYIPDTGSPGQAQ